MVLSIFLSLFNCQLLIGFRLRGFVGDGASKQARRSQRKTEPLALQELAKEKTRKVKEVVLILLISQILLRTTHLHHHYKE